VSSSPESPAVHEPRRGPHPAAPAEGPVRRAELRDLGFRPYVGARHPPSHNTWVMFRYGLARAWASLLLKLVLLLAWGPALIAAVAFAVVGFIAAQNPGQMPGPVLADYARRLSGVQTWLFVTSAAVGAATGALAEDRARGAFTFYFTKPLSQGQYLAGRGAALFVLLTLVHALPCTLFALCALALDDASTALSALRVLGALWAAAVAAGAVVTAVALAVSSAGPSPTLSAFIFLSLWVVPYLGASIASLGSELSFARYVSLPGLLATFTTPLFASSSEVTLPESLAALAALAAVSVGCLFFAHDRLVRASRLS
jgi:ABC-type transport system involved in multi-copper enzyme maturation permease subunit